ncbi:hypothetical protein [Streptomyces sp. NPDC047024]|uniref:hypothetical protein n=1 Tax=Streptomyces sp. NPDC047024 TaxID=3155476 RepID=UPI0033DF1100
MTAINEPLYGAASAPVRDQLLEGTEHVAPASLPKPVTDLFAAIAEALDVPLASTDVADGEAADSLLTLRAAHVRILLESLATHPTVSLHRDAADVRAYVERTPVTYRTFDEQKAADAGLGEGQ